MWTIFVLHRYAWIHQLTWRCTIGSLYSAYGTRTAEPADILLCWSRCLYPGPDSGTRTAPGLSPWQSTDERVSSGRIREKKCAPNHTYSFHLTPPHPTVIPGPPEGIFSPCFNHIRHVWHNLLALPSASLPQSHILISAEKNELCLNKNEWFRQEEIS